MADFSENLYGAMGWLYRIGDSHPAIRWRLSPAADVYANQPCYILHVGAGINVVVGKNEKGRVFMRIDLTTVDEDNGLPKGRTILVSWVDTLDKEDPLYDIAWRICALPHDQSIGDLGDAVRSTEAAVYNAALPDLPDYLRQSCDGGDIVWYKDR
jgi:hypothetical protein